MNIQDLGNGYSRLTAPNGVVDKRTGVVYSEVICKNKDIGYFAAYESSEE